MSAWVRRIHKWIGLLIGVQFMLWMGSGALMSLLDSEKVSGSLSRTPKLGSPQWPDKTFPIGAVLAKQPAPVRTVGTGWLLGKPVLQLSNSKGTSLVDALTGDPVVVDDSTARDLALASYAGTGEPAAPRLLARSSEVRKHKGAVWAVDFSDADETAVYVSAETGAIVAHRNSTWRLFDFFWMLHIMDYWDREDFNNPLVIGAGIGGLWLALSGTWLLITSLRLAEFVPARFRKSRELVLLAEDGVMLRPVTASTGDTVFVALSKAGVDLPSQCGGGQSCGLCVVRVRDNAPAPTSGDADHISPGKLAAGYRLACNLGINHDMELEIPSAATPGHSRIAVVARIRDITPSMREIVLTLEREHDHDFWPGSYLQVHVPAYEIALGTLGAAGASIGASELAGTNTISNVIGVRRCYSLSSPNRQDKRTLTLLVRLMANEQGISSQPFGIGSSYMFSLREGDRVEVAGPFGDFTIRKGTREKIFIGGGAGMAPLRAMIRQLLEEGDKNAIHFWYGARNLTETPYLEEMTELVENFPNFSWQLVLSDEPVSTGVVLNGLVHDRTRELFLDYHPDLSTCDFYVCGPPAMLSATRRMLSEIGVPEASVSFDDFQV